MSELPLPEDWPDDFSHENGNYRNTCIFCGKFFTGHKRRNTCKICAAKPELKPGEPTFAEIKAIILAEYSYWSKIENDAAPEISLGATGACANILTAVMGIRRAPWHPPKP